MTVSDVCALGSRLTPGRQYSPTSKYKSDFYNAYNKLSRQVALNKCELFMLNEPDTDGATLVMLCTRIDRCGTAKHFKDPPPAVIPPFKEGRREAIAREHLALNGEQANFKA